MFVADESLSVEVCHGRQAHYFRDRIAITAAISSTDRDVGPRRHRWCVGRAGYGGRSAVRHAASAGRSHEPLQRAIEVHDFGRPATPQGIESGDIDVRPVGQGLPDGSGNANAGTAVAQR
jgi:hypothetical protein